MKVHNFITNSIESIITTNMIGLNKKPKTNNFVHILLSQIFYNQILR